MNTVVKFYPKDAAKDPDNVLEQAFGQYSDIVVMGWNNDGELDVRASLTLDHKEVLWILETFKHKLLAGDFSEQEE